MYVPESLIATDHEMFLLVVNGPEEDDAHASRSCDSTVIVALSAGSGFRLQQHVWCRQRVPWQLAEAAVPVSAEQQLHRYANQSGPSCQGWLCRAARSLIRSACPTLSMSHALAGVASRHCTSELSCKAEKVSVLTQGSTTLRDHAYKDTHTFEIALLKVAMWLQQVRSANL